MILLESIVAASTKPFEQAADYCRPRGSVVCVGLPPDTFVKADAISTVMKMISIKGSYVGNRRDTAEAIDFFARGVVSAPYKVVGLSELPHVYELMEKSQIAGRYVLDTSR